MRTHASLLLALFVCGGASASTDPRPGQLVDAVVTRRDPAQTYAVYLPKEWTPEKRWPVLLVFDPRSRGAHAASIFQDGAENLGWILISSNNTRSDGPWDPNLAAVNALIPELDRYSPDPRRLYAAGFSGGAMLAWVLATKTDLVRGVIGVGGRVPEGEPPPDRVGFAHYGFAGADDFNWREMLAIERLLEKGEAPHRFETFDGTHQWFAAEHAGRAMRWMEVLAMRQQLVERDDALIDRLVSDETRAFDREKATDPIAAVERADAVAILLEGMRAPPGIVAEAGRMRLAPAFRRQKRDRERWMNWETGMLRRLAAAITPDPEKAAVVPGRIAGDLRVREVVDRAAESGEEGRAARRVASSIHAQFSFYLTRAAFQRRDYREAESFLKIAVQVRPGDATSWYNLAAARARLGNGKGAIESLERAVSEGFSDRKHLEADEDFTSLRDDQRFRSVVSRLRPPE